MYWPSENPHTEQVLRHLAEIGAGHCEITDETIASEADPDMRQILVGLLCLHEDLVYAQQLQGKAETAREAVAAERERLLGERQRAITARDEFLAMASHELRTPLSTLQLQVSSLARALGTQTEPRERSGERVVVLQRQVDRLIRLVTEMLDVSRLATGRLEVQLGEVDLGALVGQVVERFDEEIAHRGVEISVRANRGVRGRWDESRIDQVITNLLSNALKYGAGNPIEIAVTQEGERARVEVTDHGIGISEADQANLFTPFTRAVATWQYGGLGVGLWICRQIVTLHGGAVSVRSRPTEGSRFTVELPCSNGGRSP